METVKGGLPAAKVQNALHKTEMCKVSYSDRIDPSGSHLLSIPGAAAAGDVDGADTRGSDNLLGT